MPISPLDALSFRNGVAAKNRVFLAPLTNQQSHLDGTLSDEEFHWLEARAKGGFGLVETCASHVALDGQGWQGELGIYDDKLLPGLARLASSISAQGALGVVQIFHGGVRAPSKLTGKQPWSASTWEDATPGFEPPRAGTEADINRVIIQFRDAAIRAHRAGFQGVELHGAHGYLLSQFLSTTMNTRTDAWGGSLENRARLIRECTRAVRAAVPARFLVGVRISPEDFGQARGLDLDESIQVARWLVEDGIEFLHLSLWDWTRNTTKRPNEHPIPLFRSAIGDTVKIVVAGKIWSRQDAEAVLARGADAVALGRSGIANPDWPHRIADAGWEPKRPPLTEAELIDRAVSPGFVKYLRAFKGFVAE
jgi:2,4-dienoyl-CoA reductase-like NADH-dependent reductase (Old Yellow Enzyme family)